MFISERYIYRQICLLYRTSPKLSIIETTRMPAHPLSIVTFYPCFLRIFVRIYRYNC